MCIVLNHYHKYPQKDTIKSFRFAKIATDEYAPLSNMALLLGSCGQNHRHRRHCKDVVSFVPAACCILNTRKKVLKVNFLDVPYTSAWRLSNGNSTFPPLNTFSVSAHFESKLRFMCFCTVPIWKSSYQAKKQKPMPFWLAQWLASEHTVQLQVNIPKISKDVLSQNIPTTMKSKMFRIIKYKIQFKLQDE